MNVDLIACSESASVDGQTGRMSLFNVLEEFIGQIFPGIVPSLTFVVVLSREIDESEEVKLDVRIKLNESILLENSISGNFLGKPRLRTITNIAGLPISEPGRLVFEVFNKKKLIGVWRILVHSAPPAVVPSRAPSETSATRGISLTARKKAAKKKRL